jgi:hypothetical protein
VRWNGRIFEALAAGCQHREALELYHSALEARLGSDRFVTEMAPVWGNKEPDRGVVGEGPVGLPWLGRSRFFRHEVRRWRNGVIPDVSEAVASPRRLSANRAKAQEVLELVPAFRTVHRLAERLADELVAGPRRALPPRTAPGAAEAVQYGEAGASGHAEPSGRRAPAPPPRDHAADHCRASHRDPSPGPTGPAFG